MFEQTVERQAIGIALAKACPYAVLFCHAAISLRAASPTPKWS